MRDLTVQATADHFGVSRRTVERWLQQGRIVSAYRTPGGRPPFTLEKLATESPGDQQCPNIDDPQWFEACVAGASVQGRSYGALLLVHEGSRLGAPGENLRLEIEGRKIAAYAAMAEAEARSERVAALIRSWHPDPSPEGAAAR
jgi:hypothetical protein